MWLGAQGLANCPTYENASATPRPSNGPAAALRLRSKVRRAVPNHAYQSVNCSSGYFTWNPSDQRARRTSATMRLLERLPSGEIVLNEDIVGNDAVPAYAILSHTWGPVSEEVSFEDLAAGAGKDKPGYRKIRFCAEMAHLDGLRFFWIDTCCINKPNHTELSTAVISMFRWYKNAARCYAYLSDVSIHTGEVAGRLSRFPWEAEFRQSRWFTRGWTLQEMIAPTRVKFFTKEGQPLGEKPLLGEMIQEITGVPKEALDGEPLSSFSVEDRMSWAAHRSTTRDEDMAYCLLGLFDVSMPVIYGEGRDKALRRLKRELLDESSDGRLLESQSRVPPKGALPL
jgi:hypothetical protein